MISTQRFALALSLLLATSAGHLQAQAAPPAAQRPASGELKVGDRIVLTVADEPALNDTFTVTTGPAITLPQIGVVPLAGVRRSDVESHLSATIARFIKAPVVSARTLVRVAVLGEVARPGFFALRSDALLSDAITEAGGPTGEAELKKASLTRRGKVLQEGPRLRNSLAIGRTLDDLGMEAGDELMIPRRRDGERTVRIIGLIVAIPLTALALTRF